MNFVAAAVCFVLGTATASPHLRVPPAILQDDASDDANAGAAAPHLRVTPAILEEDAAFGFLGDGTMLGDSAPSCPDGYTFTPNDVRGKGKVKKFFQVEEGIENCAKACNDRVGCDMFEYNVETFKCGTYTDGLSNLGKVRGPGKAAIWTSCFRFGSVGRANPQKEAFDWPVGDEISVQDVAMD